jgi:hypothetical protein
MAREKQGFESVLELRCPEPAAAATELERLAALRQDWRLACWPVPPRMGLAYLMAERRRPGTGPAAAASTWEGDPARAGERDEEEMAICFGAGRPAADLIGADFAGHATDLYGPLLEAGP